MHAVAVGFVLELVVENLSEGQGRAVEAACRARGAWPIRFVPQRRRRVAVFGRRDVGPRLWMPDRVDDRDLLTDEADWDAPAWDMEPDLLPALADAIRVLGDELPQGFALRATWAGSKVRHDRVLTAAELADIALASGLNEFTRYRVPPH